MILPTFKPNDIDYARLMREWELVNHRNQVLERENAALLADKGRIDWLKRRTVSRLEWVLDYVWVDKLPIREAFDRAIKENSR